MDEEEEKPRSWLSCCGACLLNCIFCPCRSSQLVNSITFPAPTDPLKEYQLNLLQREDLVWLRLKSFNIFGQEVNAASVGAKKQIPAIFIKANRGVPPNFTVIYSHGNAEDISREGDFMTEFAKEINCDILVYEYPGYSLTKFTGDHKKFTNNASEQKLYGAAEAAWRFLVDDQQIDPKTIIICGRSIGSGPSVYLASRKRVRGTHCETSPRNVAGVFLISPIQSTLRAVFNSTLARCCACYDMFPNFKRISKIETHVAIMHARDDEVVQFKNGLKLAEKMQKVDFEPLWLDQGGHNEISQDVIIDHFKEFIKFLLGDVQKKYDKDTIREQRLSKLKVGAKATDKDKPQASDGEIDGTTSDTGKVLGRSQSKLPGNFVPNQIEAPVLKEFDKSNGMLKTVIGAQKSQQAKTMSKDELRRKRLEKLKSK